MATNPLSPSRRVCSTVRSSRLRGRAGRFTLPLSIVREDCLGAFTQVIGLPQAVGQHDFTDGDDDLPIRLGIKAVDDELGGGCLPRSKRTGPNAGRDEPQLVVIIKEK